MEEKVILSKPTFLKLLRALWNCEVWGRQEAEISCHASHDNEIGDLKRASEFTDVQRKINDALKDVLAEIGEKNGIMPVAD